MSKLVQAAMFVGANQPLQLIDTPLPELQAGEMLCRIEASTICGSDVRTFSGQRSGPTPCVLGHEIVGRVSEISGELHDLRGDPIRVGDRLVWSVAASCSECDRCRRGAPQKCRHLLKFGHHAGNSSRGNLYGGMAEYCLLVRGAQALRVEDSLPAALAAPASCATATVCGAARVAGELAERNVIIFGAGALGLTAAALAKSCGARGVVVCDPDAQRRNRALSMGASEVISPAECEVRREQFDFALEMSGAPSAVEAAVDSLNVGGRLILVGSVSPSRKVSLDPEAIVRRLIRIEGLHNYAPQDLVSAVDFLQQQQDNFPFAEMVEAEFLLSEANQAMQFALQSAPLRVLIRPE